MRLPFSQGVNTYLEIRIYPTLKVKSGFKVVRFSCKLTNIEFHALLIGSYWIRSSKRDIGVLFLWTRIYREKSTPELTFIKIEIKWTLELISVLKSAYCTLVKLYFWTHCVPICSQILSFI